MTENSAVREDFPHTQIAKAQTKPQTTIEYHQLSVAKLNRWAPYIEECACLKVFELSGASYARSEFWSRNRSDFHMRPRKWVWWILRFHPSLGISWPVLSERYKRDHCSILYATKMFSSQLRGGYRDVDIDAIQSICDSLQERGFPPFDVRQELNK